MQDHAGGAFRGGNIEQSLGMLSDPSVPEPEWQTRLGMLKRETNGVIIHVIGLLEGYKKSIDDGTRSILQRLDPDEIRREVAGTKARLGPITIPYRFLPPLLLWRIVRVLGERHRELTEEDRGILEKKLYRPAFIRSYGNCLKTMRLDVLPPPNRDKGDRN